MYLYQRGPQLKPKVKRRPQIKYIPPPPVVKKKEEEIKEKQEVLYKITVKTGNKPQAGTSAKVGLVLSIKLYAIAFVNRFLQCNIVHFISYLRL